MTVSARRNVLLTLAASCLAASAQDHKTWSDYGGARGFRPVFGAGSNQSLQRGPVCRSPGRTQPAMATSTSFNPLVVDGRIFVLAKNNRSSPWMPLHGQRDLDLPARTAAPPSSPTAASIIGRARIAPTAGCLFASNHYLRAIDAQTGKTIPSFGINGAVDLKEGLDRDPQGASSWSNPPRPAASSRTF